MNEKPMKVVTYPATVGAVSAPKPAEKPKESSDKEPEKETS